MIHPCIPEKIRIYHNTAGKLPEEIKRETGCTTIFNGVLFNGDNTLCCDNRIDGKTISNDKYSYWGYAWNKDSLPVMINSLSMYQYENFISCLCAVHQGEKQIVDDNDAGMGGTRGRMAFGFKPNGEMVILGTSDANGAMKLSAARDKLAELGCRDALILDGGGSCYLDCPSGKVDTTEKRKRANRMYILVWERNAKPERKFRIALDPGHGTAELNCSPDKRYYEYKFAWDMANRVKDLLEQTECFEVMLTKNSAEETPSLSTRAVRANTFGADIYISQHSNAVSGGWNDTVHGLTAWIYARGGKREELAKLLLDQYRQHDVELFGQQLYTNNFTVLAQTAMPAVLIEHYFHTCHGDVDKLLSDTERDKLAYAQACGICEYFNLATDIIPLSKEEETKEEDVRKDIIYRVQTGAFSNEDNAKAMAERLKKEGYKTIIQEVKKS